MRTTPDELVEVARAIIGVQRDHGNRTNRKRARLKYLLDELGVDWFRGEVEAALGRPLAPYRDVEVTGFHDHLGWHDQGDGRWFRGVWIESGRIHDEGELRLRTGLRRVVRELAERYGVDMAGDCHRLVMGWDEVRTLAADPLVTIGAHTKGHFAVAKLSDERAYDEMVGSADRLEQELGQRPAHFSFPYGDPGSAGPRDFALAKQTGFKTAVTTRRGVLFAAHRRYLTALPRVSLAGDYQSLTYTALYLSGAPFALSNRFREVSAA